MNDGYNLLMRQTLTPRTAAHTLNSTFRRSIDNTNVHQHETIEGSEIEEAGQRNQFVKLSSTEHTHTRRHSDTFWFHSLCLSNSNIF